jgi:hypothetical protein
MEMQELLNRLNRIEYTLRSVSVSGPENMDYMLGIFRELNSLKNDLVNPKPKETPVEIADMSDEKKEN